jgi:hypothetical protein
MTTVPIKLPAKTQPQTIAPNPVVSSTKEKKVDLATTPAAQPGFGLPIAKDKKLYQIDPTQISEIFHRGWETWVICSTFKFSTSRKAWELYLQNHSREITAKVTFQ